MKIGLFTDTYDPQINGVVTSINVLKNELERMGHDVYIFAPKLTGAPISDKIVYFKSAKYPPLPEHEVAYSMSGNYKKLKELQLDIVHSHTPFSIGLLAIFLAKKHKIPLVHTYHTLFSEYVHYTPFGQFIGGWLSTQASKKYCQSSDAVIVPSEYMKKELRRYGVSREIAVIPTGTRWPITEITKVQKIIDSYKIPKNTQIISYAGRIAKEKNIEFLLEVFCEIARRKKHVIFAIIGDGPKKKSIERLAKKLGILDRVIFTGYLHNRADLYGWLKASTAFVFSSVTETQGLAVLEAMAVGTPVVAVDARGISDIIHKNVGGYAAQLDVSQFSRKLLRLLTSKATRERKSKEAESVARSHSAERMATAVEKMYTRLIGEHATV